MTVCARTQPSACTSATRTHHQGHRQQKTAHQGHAGVPLSSALPAFSSRSVPYPTTRATASATRAGMNPCAAERSSNATARSGSRGNCAGAATQVTQHAMRKVSSENARHKRANRQATRHETQANGRSGGCTTLLVRSPNESMPATAHALIGQPRPAAAQRRRRRSGLAMPKSASSLPASQSGRSNATLRQQKTMSTRPCDAHPCRSRTGRACDRT